MKRLAGFLILMAACGGDATGATGDPFTGHWHGTYTALLPDQQSPQEGEADFDLAQDGGAVSGTFTTTLNRAGTVSGSASGNELSATFTFTDTCGGSARTTATLHQERSPDELEGSYETSDCMSKPTTGTYHLVHQ